MRAALGPVVQDTNGEDDGRQPDRDVDPEDPTPRGVGDDGSSEDDAEDGSEALPDRVVAVGLSALLGWEEIGYHSPAVGRDESTADALQEPETDDRELVEAEGAERRPDDEDDESGSYIFTLPNMSPRRPTCVASRVMMRR